MIQIPKYLIKIVKNKKFLDDLVIQHRLYVNNSRVYRKERDNFIADKFEGIVFSPKDKLHCSLWIGDSPKTSQKVYDLPNTSCYVNAFSYSFYVLEDENIKFMKDDIDLEKETAKAFQEVLSKYKKENGGAYFALYDAKHLLYCIDKYCRDNNISYFCRKVNYSNANDANDIKDCLNGKIEKSLFKKQEKYKYQNEFRFIFGGNPKLDHIELKIEDLTPICTGEYMT